MILAIKTSDDTASLLLYGSLADTEPIATTSWQSGRELADQLLGRLIEFVEAGGGGAASLTGVVIFSGPGSFTSLRIGHAVANALADSLGIPVVGSAGDGWPAAGLRALKTAKPGHPALPVYGAEANVTRPKT